MHLPRGGEETNICPFLKLAFPESAPVCAGAFFGAMAGREIPCVTLRGGAAASGGGRVFCSEIFIVCRKTGARAAIFGGENAGLLLKRGGKMREGGWKIRRAGRLEEFY